MPSTLYGGNGNDYLYGRQGNDMLSGDAGGDTMYGEDGDDRILAGSDLTTDDSISGGTGHDVVDYQGTKQSLNLIVGVTKQGIRVSDAIKADTEPLIAGNGNDIIRDNGDHSLTIYGMGGANVLVGGAKDHDTLVGGSGVDTIVSNNPLTVAQSQDKSRDIPQGVFDQTKSTVDVLDKLSLKVTI